MQDITKSNLGRRVVLLVLVSMFLMLAVLGVSGWLAVRESATHVVKERSALADATSGHLDYILRQNLERLDNFQFIPGVNIEDDDLEPEKRALRTTYFGSIFNDGVFFVDSQGIVVWMEPYYAEFIGSNITGYAPIQQSFESGKPMVSDVLSTNGRKEILIVSSLRNREGRIVGLVGGRINPVEGAFPNFTAPLQLGESSHIDVIDSNGIVLASSDSGRVLLPKDYRQDEPEVTQLSYLSMAPWSVSVGQLERVVFAPVHTMERRFIIFGFAALVVALFLSWGMAHSLVRPVSQLTRAARNISRGDLSQPVPQLGSGEVGDLGRSFDTMRLALGKSRDEIQQWNRKLEEKVAERTRELERSYQEIEQKEAARRELLSKILSVQEEERKRIARELHDETTQSLVALVMRLEALAATPQEAVGKIGDGVNNIRGLAIRTLDNIHKIIFDLRPSVLDDLGLLAALRWYAENRLAASNIKAHIELPDEDKKLQPQIEIALFRIVQEAVTNIIRHAEAHNVILTVEFVDSRIRIEVEDDGKGFDTGAVSTRRDKNQGLGLLGMEERVALLGGKFFIDSQPGSGTHLVIDVPLD